MSDVYSKELERVAEEDRREEGSRRRAMVLLIVALVVMLLGICSLGYFYLKVVGVDAETYEPEVKQGYSLVFVEEYYGFGNGADEQFNRPHDVNVTSTGGILVADSQNGRVVQMTRAGDLVAQVGLEQQWGPGNLDMPNGVAEGPDGRIYVTDGGSRGPHGKLMIYTPGFSAVETEVVFPPTNPPIIPRVFGDELYVTCASGLQVFDLDGNLLRAWGGVVGKSEDEYSFPNGVVKRRDGTVVVAESNNRRIKILDSRGEIESIVGTPPAGIQDVGPSLFSLPMGLAEDEDGRLYLADAWAYKLRVLDSAGTEIAAFGELGSERGQFDAPAGLTYLGGREFLLADELNHRVVRLRITTPDDASQSGIEVADYAIAYSTCLWIIPLVLLLMVAAYAVARRRRSRRRD